MNHRITSGMRVFNVFNVIVLSALALAMFLPYLNIFAQSLSSAKAITNGWVSLWPVEFTWINYQYVFQDPTIWRAFLISVIITVCGTAINLVMTSSLAYPLSRPEYVGRKYIILMVLFTMIFSAPLIPVFILIKSLGMMNTLWAVMIPNAIAAFNFFIMRSFFMNIPSELIDSSRIDGCGEMGILWRIVVPLSKPAMATMGIYYAVYHWNSYTNALYYLNERSLYPLQIKLRQMIDTDTTNMDPNAALFSETLSMSPEGIKMATVFVATIPILLVYPFLQKYFVKGMMIGSVKA
ncbi:carbohydrate ABC transporter permease [Paenibacillus xerothermodurans]|uniref:Carbohydrate ABC transporter permease n=1 Tax=Paenibacillus xerothermodurans TaxID=1977292 RepID=A0A2W1P687_PAEXE|nr:carbohydrate ABC transporter permease [Paenibacillus xerothermodurans]PZE22578.1 carbohydrate ABC transporter permease [Paenibacillus xerothermodurans]